MENITSLKELGIESILKVDPFDQAITLNDEINFVSKQLIDKQTFFDKVYARTNDNKIYVRTGSQLDYSKQDLDAWLETIHKSTNSVVVFISGYAGCGKTVFSQYILKTQLKTVDYDYSYYNYDIGSYYDSKQRRISNVICAHFLDQYTKLLRSGENHIIDEFEQLLYDIANIYYINAGAKISSQFIVKGPYKKLKQEYINELRKHKDFSNAKNEEAAKAIREIDAKFKAVIMGQLDDFELQEVLSLDYLLRIAVYIAHPIEENRKIYVCYDNMDSIENFDELKTFDNTLTAIRRNIDNYINLIAGSKFYAKRIKRPTFVIISTYRKITAAKVEINNQAERCEDPASENKYIYYIDASHNYRYQDIVISRGKYFRSLFEKSGEDLSSILEKLKTAESLTNINFIQNRYAGFWNNNYRTCVSIMADALENHSSETTECINLFESNEDGYDNDGLANIGASSIFMGIICKISGEKGIWNSDRLNLVKLTDIKKTYKISELTSLSRLILTYMGNQKDGSHARPVSMKELFDEFSDLYGYPNGKNGGEIIDAVTKMLTRDETDTWRRPIYYHKNAPDDKNGFHQQWLYYCGKTEEKTLYTELLLCDCGYLYVRRLMSDFEFFSSRRFGKNHVNLYLVPNIKLASKVIDNVIKAVEGCCIKLNAFQDKYMEIKGIDFSYYLTLPIHPKTRSNVSQLHAERIIFSHIYYLDYCRKHHLKKTKNSVQKKEVNSLFKESIERYLDLYLKYIAPRDKRRLEVASDLKNQLDKLEKAPMNQWVKISIQTSKHFNGLSDENDFEYLAKVN